MEECLEKMLYRVLIKPKFMIKRSTNFYGWILIFSMYRSIIQKEYIFNKLL